MADTNKKTRDWSFLLPNGLPTTKVPSDLEKIRNSLVELDPDLEGFDFATEQSFRDFVLNKRTVDETVKRFLEKSLVEAGIEFNEKGFLRLNPETFLEFFFDVFTLGTEEAEQVENPTLTKKHMDYIYQHGKGEIVRTISYANFVVTDKMPIRAQDNFALRLSKNAPQITHDKAALFNTSLKKTVAVGHLEGDVHDPRLVFAEAIDFDSIRKNRRHEIILFAPDGSEENFYAVECELGFRELEEAKQTLCIDFGTSNTTAGSYGILDEQKNQPEIVRFPDVTGTSTRQMIPTLVYVDSCESDGSVRYAFGYEAKKRILADHFESRATVFHEIKSWINDIDRTEEIFDAQGNNGTVRREDVIKAYLHHVISLSEQYFHKKFKHLHFSTPVKLKDSFLDKMRQMFPSEESYLVLDDDSSLDEGIAIVYNHISGHIRQMAPGETATVFAIDCGGGTTDLAKCEYSQKESHIDGKKILSVKTSFENGDSAFGGNNITYRILQLLKIKIDAFLRHRPNPDMLEIIADNEIDIMTKLDEPGKLLTAKKSLYERFEAAYAEAEARIPTRYAEAKYNDDRRYMRRNYNYLWQMAEAVKIEFYKSSSTVAVDFSKEADRNIFIGEQEDYYLYVREDADSLLEKNTEPPDNISITIKEINRIICPDIYALLNVLLSEGYRKNALQDVNFFRLSGQSCNITLFHDLMKEFVPGRKIRRKSGVSAGIERTEKLKIACIEGSIRYIMAKEFSQIQPKIEMSAPKMLYEICEDNGESGQKSVLSNDGAVLLRNFISRRRVHFVVRDAYGQQKNSVFYNFETDKRKRTELTLGDLKDRLISDTYWSSDKIEEFIMKPLQNITPESNDQNEQCIFLLPAKNGYGFRIYQVRVSCDDDKKTIYELIKSNVADKADGEYHSFEQPASFFDGKR